MRRIAGRLRSALFGACGVIGEIPALLYLNSNPAECIRGNSGRWAV